MVKPGLFFAVFLHVFMSASFACGQDFPMLHYTVEDGLPSNNVYDIYRDSKGFLWTATDKGVARFNGMKFETFSTSNGLPDNDIFFIQEDKEGRLWFGSFNGALCFFKNDTFHNAANTPFLKVPTHITHTKHISVERDSSLIISFFDQSVFVTISRDRRKIFYLDSLHDPAIVSSLVFRKKISANRFKLICSDKIVTIDTFCNIIGVQPTDRQFSNPQRLFSGCQDQEYLFNEQCVYTTDMQSVRRFPQGFVKRNFMHQVYCSDSKVFYTTSDGVYVNDTLHLLKENNASGITQDNEGNYWLSTLNNGIFALKKGFQRTKLLADVYENKAKYVFPFKGDIFFVTEANDLYDIRNGQVNCIRKSRRGSNDFPLEFGFTIDSSYRVISNYKLDSLVTYDLHMGKVTTLLAGDGDIAAKSIFVSGNYVYVKRAHDISRIRMDSSPGIKIRQEIGSSQSTERIFGMAMAGDGSIWYSTIDKLLRVTNNDTAGAVQAQFKAIALKYFDFFGKYLVGYTQDNRLLVCHNYNSPNLTIDSISPYKCIWNKLAKLDSSHVLISTNNLFMLLTLGQAGREGKCSVRAVESPFVPLNAEAFCSSGANTYFFKDRSVTVLDNNSISEIPNPPSLHFTSLKTGKATYLINSEVEIQFDESRHMNISFSTQSFNAKDVLYQYSVSKTEQENWQDVRGEEINLVNSGYGLYFIKVKAKSFSSGYGGPIVFTLHVLRPYWARWWFIALVILAVTVLAGIFLRYRLQYILKKKEKEHATEIKFMRSEYKALNALMNPHFIFNTLNNVQGLVNRNDKLAANEYIRVFADLVRQNMHNISKELIPLQKEVELVSNYLVLEKLRFKDHLNYTINVHEGLDLSEIMIPPLLVQPLVENSIKHGILPMESELGFIVIDIYERGTQLYIDVKDNGVGMHAQKTGPALKHESFGLKNVRTRIEQLSIMQNKKILFHIFEAQDDQQQLRWTVARIVIPE